jgi:hypothetical protein
MEIFGTLWGMLWNNMIWVLGAIAVYNWPWHI